MNNSSSALAAVWREACRHIEIRKSTENIVRVVAAEVPLAALLIRRLDVERSAVETVAVGTLGATPVSESGRTNLEPIHEKKLLAWMRKGEVFHSAAPGDLDVRLWGAIPATLPAHVIAGPLRCADAPAGILIAVGSSQDVLDDRHTRLVQSLLEPFSAALDNDGRLREMAALREAAEAERSSLLVKLGREALREEIVGAQTGLRTVMERVEQVAESDAPVLIIGDTGTGKEVVARAIHTRSHRARGPFLRVNCGAIPPEMVDSQLFGHERGAFTGAVAMRKGWFERADEGTLFLDEIAELPPPAQVRLLRVLQDGWMERVGGHAPVHVDVRIVAATHRDLAAMVKNRTFREDLWYRIAVFPIMLPPLRERTDDLPALARHFAARAATRFRLPAAMPTEADIEMLRGYSWPGNIRELAAVIDRAAILGNGHRLEVASALGVSAGGAQMRGSEQTLVPAPPSASGVMPLNEAMKRHIEQALRVTEGRIDGRNGAARLLAINPHTLRARMRKLGVRWRDFRPVPG